MFICTCSTIITFLYIFGPKNGYKTDEVSVYSRLQTEYVKLYHQTMKVCRWIHFLLPPPPCPPPLPPPPLWKSYVEHKGIRIIEITQFLPKSCVLWLGTPYSVENIEYGAHHTTHSLQKHKNRRFMNVYHVSSNILEIYRVWLNVELKRY